MPLVAGKAFQMIWDKGTSKRNLRKGLAADAAARSGNESGIRRRFGRTRRSGFAAVGSGLQGVRRPPPSQVQPLIPRLDDGFCWLTDGSSLDFRQGTISQSTGTISPAQFRHTISAFHCEVIHRGVRRLPCDNKTMVTNATIEALLGRRSIRKFKDEAIDDDTRATLETVAQHAASSQFLNDWSAIRIIDPAIKAKLAEFGHQPYIATAPVAVRVRYRRAPQRAHRRTQGHRSRFRRIPSEVQLSLHPKAQNDAVLALHAMETAAYSLGLGCVILGSLLNNIPGLIDVLNLPEYTYPVLGLAIGKPIRTRPSSRACRARCSSSRTPTRLTPMAYSTSCPPSTRKFTGTTICAKPTVRWTPSAIRSPTISRQDVSHQTLLDKAAAQGFRLDQ